MNMSKMLSQARGDSPAEFVIKNVTVPNLFSYETIETDVAISGDRIIGTGNRYTGINEIDGQGKYLVPGFIDGHCHIESTMLSPEGFVEMTLKRGTTTVFADPHEIANTSGMDGLEYMYRASSPLPMDIYLNAPSCVPASPFETPREKLDAFSIQQMFHRGWCRALGEVMDYPGVIKGNPEMIAKLMASTGQVLTGHAPGITGKDLCAYMLSGCNSDHESSTIEEAFEKLRAGMWLMIREGASEHNLAELAPLIVEDERRCSQCIMVSDDLNVSYLAKKGHMDIKLRMAQDMGISFLGALRMVTLSPARYFRLYDKGAIAPGYKADMVLMDSGSNCSVDKVWKDGVLTVDNGELISGSFKRQDTCPSPSRCVKIPAVKDLEIPSKVPANIRVIGIKPGQVITDSMVLPATIENGLIVADKKSDIVKLAVIERNRGTGRTGIGFIHGLGLKKGAIASSVAHDAHNFIVAGMNDRDMTTALRRIRDLGGGFAVALDGEIKASLALPVGGLMSNALPDALLSEYEKVEREVKELGCDTEHPFMVMAFLSLTVIPSLKLTDQGYIDLQKGGIQPLLV